MKPALCLFVPILCAERSVDGVDFRLLYEYIVVNDDLEKCVAELHSIVNAARNIPGRNGAFIDKIKEELKTLKEGAE